MHGAWLLSFEFEGHHVSLPRTPLPLYINIYISLNLFLSPVPIYKLITQYIFLSLCLNWLKVIDITGKLQIDTQGGIEGEEDKGERVYRFGD